MSSVLHKQISIAICQSSDLVEKIGVRALFGNDQVAIFRVLGKLYAINAIDPFTQAAVLARGIVGSIGDTIVVASPIYKQHFSLLTGQCIEDETIVLKTYHVFEDGGMVYLTEV